MISPRISKNINASLVVSFVLLISLSNCCKELEIYCGSGEDDCLPYEKICDGKIDCPGGSDEASDICIQQVCPAFAFRCAYGACVPEAARCNGTAECADNSDEAAVLCSPNFTKDNSICLKDEFMCNSGECIPQEDVCDGKVNCLDRSDESVEVCASVTCETGMYFQCGYGACIRADKKCDGVEDCADGSDETFNLCGVQPPKKHIKIKPITPLVASTPTPPPTTAIVSTSANTCTVPDIKNSRIILEANPAKIFRAGEQVQNFNSIVYQCKRGFFREGPEFNLCFNGNWFSKIDSVCIQYCPHEVLRGITFNVRCIRDATTVPCDNRISPGTIAKISCPTKYRVPDHNPIQTLLCSENGQWDYPPSRCEPICGDELIPSVPFLTNAKDTNITAVPWHVGVYINNNGMYKHHCGGTVISAKVVISAAHCFWDSANQVTYDNSLYSIGAGKYFRDYYMNENRKGQFQNVSQIAVPQEYAGADSNFKADIAVVVLINALIFSEFVSPICIQWKRAGAKSIVSGSYGQVAGWGKDESGGFSNVLKTIYVPASSNEACRNEVDQQYAESITDDKFCVLNKYNTNACQGDSGGGFAAKKEIAGKNRYYLWGVVSTGVPLGLTCSNYQFVSYTNIQYYEDFITDLEIRNRAK